MFNWFSFLIYTISTAATPGPNNIMSMSNGSKLGFKRSFPFNLGIWVGFSAVSLMCTVFCSALSAYIPKIKLPMLILGAIYLLYLAWATYKSSSEIEDNTTKSGFVSGLLLQFINPKIYLACIMALEAFILPFYSNNISALIGFALTISTIGFICTLCWSAFGSVFRILFTTHAKLINTIMALLLVYCAISLFL